MDSLDRALAMKGATAYAAYGSTICDGDIRYLTGFSSADAILYIKRYTGPAFIVVSAMELERAMHEARVQVRTRKEVGFYEFLAEEKDNRTRAMARTIASLGGDHILLPPHFPYSIARELSRFCEVSIDEEETVKVCRARKSEQEIEYIAASQGVAEEAMAIAIGMISGSRIRGERLVYRGKILTSERVKAAIHKHFVDAGCTARGTIVSCGKETAIPHHEGTGALLPNEPIVIDIFPQNEYGYYADMTRTVVKGEPSPEILDMYRAVKEAKALALGKLHAGANGMEIHQAVVEFFSAHGYESDTQGFVHNLGHGIGLEVHELPVLGKGGGMLEAGNVVTVEPGLYYSDIGGVRLEDMVVIRQDGFESLTSFEEECSV